MSASQPAASRGSNDVIIQLEEGFERVKREGIDPFIRLIETRERDFFKAKEFMNLYDLIFKMCIQRDPYNWSEKMYERYTQSIVDYLNNIVAPDLREARSQYESTFLRVWADKWDNHCKLVKGLSKLFMYLDRFFTVATSDQVNPPLKLQPQGFKLYRDVIFNAFVEHARNCILNAIRKERENEEFDRLLLNRAVMVFVELSFQQEDTKLKIYSNDLEKHIIKQSREYYDRLSRVWLENDSCPNYLEKVESALVAERRRVEAYLNHTTMEPLLRECAIQMLREPQKELLGKSTGLSDMLATNRRTDLARLYALYSRFPQDLVPIGEMLREFIKQSGLTLLDSELKVDQSAPDTNHSLVTKLIDLHDRFSSIVRECFGNNTIFQRSLKDGFEAFINQDHRVSKLLARFVNDILKKHSKLNTKDMSSTLDSIVFLYGYITEKDVFELDYQRYLATRLLMGLCESEHFEKAMIAKLKTECGYQWTNRLEGMFKDVQLSQELMQAFRSQPGCAEVDLGFSFEVTVCTTGFWPQQKTSPCLVPTDVSAACDRYRDFYLRKRNGHKIEWRFDQGQAECQTIFSPKVRRTLVVSTYQMMILLVFNQLKTATFKQILDKTNIPRNDIVNHLMSLAHPKVQVLAKKPPTSALEDAHMFRINPAYKSTLLKVNVPVIVIKAATGKSAGAGVELARRHQMDAAIVRIMKARKTMKHAQLVGEVMQQLSARFKPKPADIRKRVEAMIEQEYLARDPKDRQTYNYTA